MNISVSSSFIDTDAEGLVRAILDAGVNVAAVISTREPGDNPTTDAILARIKSDYPDVLLIEHSAKSHGRLGNPSAKERFDSAILRQLRGLVDMNVMVGDMIVKGPTWCQELPSLNLHPDLPGGVEGMYWNVVGEWVRTKRSEIGGMMHLVTPTLDAGAPITYFRLPARGIVNGLDLGPLWEALPPERDILEGLVDDQVKLKNEPTHPLFQELRRAEVAFEQHLVIHTIAALAAGELQTHDNLPPLDLTHVVVGDAAIWPGIEHGRHNHETL